MIGWVLSEEGEGEDWIRKIEEAKKKEEGKEEGVERREGWEGRVRD